MIKINRDFALLAKEHKEKIKKDYKISDNLEAKIKNSRGNEKKIYIFIKNNLDDILQNDISDLELKIQTIENYFLKIPTYKKRILKDIKNIFRYDLFSEYKKKKYNAYQLVKELNVNVCPFCNRQYIHTLEPDKKAKKGGTRATLDHFFLKSKYPYLALSFWNLVPSCYSCNTQLRGEKELGLHPYVKGFENIIHFYTEIIDLTEFIGNSKKYFKIELKKYKKIKPNNVDYENAKKNETVLRLNDIYQLHKDYVREIIQKAIIYDKEYSNYLYKEFDGVFSDKNEAQRMMLNNYTNTIDFEKRPLAKLTRDIADELGLI